MTPDSQEIDAVEEALREMDADSTLHNAKALMSHRGAKIIRGIYDEEEKAAPDLEWLAKLERSYAALGADRRSLYKASDSYKHWKALEAKYQRLMDAPLDVYE